MARSIIYALLCLALLAAVQFAGPTGRGLLGAGAETQIWCLLSSWVSALGLLLCAGLCVAAGRGRAMHPLLPLGFPLLGLFVTAVGWIVKAGEVGEFDEAAITSYEERLLALGTQGWHAIEVPAVGAYWAGAAFVGALLVAGCHQRDKSDTITPDRAKWILLLLGLLAAVGAAVAAVIIAGGEVVVSYALERDIQPWAPSFEPLYHFRGRPLQLSLLAMLLIPATLLPLGFLGDAKSGKLGQAPALAATALIGAVVSLSLAGPLWIAALRQEAMTITEYQPPYVWLGHPTNVTNDEWGLLLLVARALLISIASIVALTTLLRTSGELLNKTTPTVLVVVLLLGFLGSGSIADARIEAGVGGPCVENCTCRHVVVARAMGEEAPSSDRMEPCELWQGCSPLHGPGVVESSDLRLPSVEALECPTHDTVIAVTRNAILVDDRRVVDLRDGRVDPSNKREGASGYFVNPVFDALTEAADNQKLIASRSPHVEFRGVATVFIDRDAQARTIDELLFTAKKTGYRSFDFLVKSPDITDRSPYRVMPVSHGRIVKLDEPSARGRCRELLLLESRPIEGICAGTYEAAGCVGLAVAGKNVCSARESELAAELWNLSLTKTQLELRTPSEEVLRAETATELAELVERRVKGGAAVRLLAIERPEDLPYSMELRARSALLSTRVFADAVLAAHLMPDGTSPPREDNELSVLMGTRVGDSFGYGGPDPTSRALLALMGDRFPRGIAQAPSVSTGNADVRGSLSKEAIRRHVRRNILDIRYCYESAWARDQSLAGRVEVRFVISPSGAVSSSSVASSTLGNPTVEQCIARVVQSIAFPEPEGGGVVIVTYPFRFEPVN